MLLLSIKRHGGWRSNAVCEGYIDTSVENKKKQLQKFLEMTDNEPTTSTSNSFYQDFSLLGRELAIPQAIAGISQQNLNVSSKNSIR
jgi:hypothetical protein